MVFLQNVLVVLLPALPSQICLVVTTPRYYKHGDNILYVFGVRAVIQDFR